MPAGRPPKPTATLERQGTFRSHRHEARKDAPSSGGDPKPPSWLKGEALKFWKQNVPRLQTMGVVESIDTEMLAGLARLWSNWRKEQRAYERGRRKVYAVNAAWKIFAAEAAKFGFTPVDRIKLVTRGKEPDDPQEVLQKILRGEQVN